MAFIYGLKYSRAYQGKEKMIRIRCSKIALFGVFIVIFLLLSVMVHSGAAQPPVHVQDVSNRVEAPGNPGRMIYPAKSMAYARNIWDMQAFDGRIYFGMGNSNNDGPARNAKGGRIWFYDPKRKRFEIEYRTDEEQVDRFRIIDGSLVVPGHDPTDSWKYGNWYRLEAGGWTKHRNIPGGIHCYDMVGFHGKMFAALGTKPNSEFVVMSKDGGKSWKGCGVLGMRAHTLFIVGDQLHASLYRGVAAYDGKRFQEDMDREWFPGQSENQRVRLVVRDVRFKGTTLYIGAFRATDHQWTPFGLYAAKDPTHVKQIHLPGKPWDILVKDNVLYVLSALKYEKEGVDWIVRVTATRDLKEWKPLFQFESPTFARSFEYLNGYFYFGPGCQAEDVRSETGALLSVRNFR